ncbi:MULTISPECIES: ABC transporter permease [Brevibacterium]|uniref:Peptide ABC transporter permease n=2 Tax=Brevibacterium TaxID=1696 RepID=A0A2A3YZ74_BREAU|nr:MULTISPECIES: ABC transporter permease [Brevibacterium]MDN5588073.1 ABC transporter permease [Brevibacterium sp.]PCC44604.1 peptide ABC transporter permease [Brevibacterium aurantiacum]SMX76014.1 peptide/nickel transport system permease protein [Brevibacterium aurantiacum]SMX90924.1 peptide/nickel transport system permease protein [Brevibacterium antiquum CNRZ 918]GEB22948.1 peptide ABC transporter permease [Brevibacterium aurantiacum]
MSENPSTTSAGETSMDRRRRTKLRLNASMVIGAVLIFVIVALALVSFVWTPYDPSVVDPVARLQAASPEHLFGTDKFGRDTLTWIMYGARITLMVGIVAVGIAVLIGTPIGIIAAVFAQYPWGVWLSAVIMRANDILLAFPALLLAIVFAAVYQPGTGPAMVAVGIAAIPGFARVARSGTMQVLGSEYVRAAKASNRSAPAIAIVHVLPNIAGMVIVQASVAFAISVLAEAGLSFLGLGTQAPVPSWGRMLQESQQFLSTQPELALWPGLFIALAVLGFNLLGDGLRDRFDPKMEARGNG